MQKYKSVKTYERLSKIKSDNPKFDLDTPQEIDEKFQQLCNPLELESGQHSIASLFGSVVIQTAVQGLVLSNLDGPQQVNLSRLSANILKVFDINPIQLNSLKNREEKHQYLKQQMNEIINQLLKSWSDKIFMREQKQKELDEAQRKEKQSTKSKKHFKWLNLKTKYEQLKNKLRQIVVDKLNDYENQMLALKSNQPFMLKNVAVITTRNIFENMEKYGHSNEFHFLKSLAQDRLNKIKDKQSIHKNQSVSNEKDEYQVDWNNFEENRFLDQKRKTRQLFTNEISSSNWNDLGFLPIMQQMTLLEKKKQQREHILNKYTDGEFLTAQELQFLANTSDLLNACLDKEFFQRATNQINPDLLSNMELSLAEQILKDYEEMKSATMHARRQYIRHKIEQTKLKLMAREKIQQRINQEQYNLEQNRKYIKVCTTVVHHMDRTGKFQEKYPEDLPGAQQLNDYLNGKINERQFISKLREMAYEKEKRRRSRYEMAVNFESFQSNQRSNSIQQNNNNQDKDKDEQSTNLKNIQLSKQKQEYYKQMSRPKTTTGFQFITNIKRHIYHPSTKVIINKKTEHDDMEMAYINPIRAQYNQYEQDKFKLGLKSHPALRQKNNFKTFYSGGPPQLPDEMRSNHPNYKASQKEIRAAIVIQRKLRSLFREKKLRQKLEDRRKQIYYLFKDNCENIMHQVELDRQDQNIQNLIIIKQLEKCKQSAKDTINYGRLRTEENQKKNKAKTQSTLFSTDVTTPKNPSQQSIKFPSAHNKVKVEHLFEAVNKNRYMMMLQTHFVYAAGDLNCQTIDGETPLHIATRNSNQDLVEWLLKNGADPYILNVNSQTAYDIAQFQNKSNILRLFKQYCPF